MISIRKGEIEDAAQVSRLLLELSEEFIAGEFSESGKQNFLRQLTVEKIAERISADNFRFHLAEGDGDLVGVVAVRDNKHLLFVCRTIPPKTRTVKSFVGTRKSREFAF